MPNESFKREERLKSRKKIEQLFKEGQSFGHYPLRIVWVMNEEPVGPFPAQFALSVPKRKFPKAVHRNRLRRQVREAYRLHKWRLYKGLEGTDQQISLMVLYTAKEQLPYKEIEQAMKGMIHRFLKKQKRITGKSNQ